MIIHILRFKSHKQRPEPLERAKVPAHPEEIDLPKWSLLVRVVHPIPDTLEDRGKRGDANTRTDKYCNLILEDSLRGTVERTVYINSG